MYLLWQYDFSHSNINYSSLIYFSSRLSSLAGDQLTKDNPAITDLSDTNRPMKIGEKYGELYDNEWTDSMELVGEMKELFPDLETGEYDEIVVHHLHKLLLVMKINFDLHFLSINRFTDL